MVHAGLPPALLRRYASAAAREGGRSLGDTLHAESNRALWGGWRRLGGVNGSRPQGAAVGGFGEMLRCGPAATSDPGSGSGSGSDSGSGSGSGSGSASARAHSEDGCSDGLAELRPELIAALVQHRGYFGASGCHEVETVLRLLRPSTGVRRIVVGHTAAPQPRVFCGGSLLAVDSSLSRHFRAYGNRYCPLDAVGSPSALEAARRARASISAGGPCAGPAVRRCEGSIARLSRASADEEWPAYAEQLLMDEGSRPMGEAPGPIALGPGASVRASEMRPRPARMMGRMMGRGLPETAALCVAAVAAAALLGGASALAALRAFWDR